MKIALAFSSEYITHKTTEQTSKLHEKLWTSRGFCSLCISKIHIFSDDREILRTLPENIPSICTAGIPKITLRKKPKNHKMVKGKKHCKNIFVFCISSLKF